MTGSGHPYLQGFCHSCNGRKSLPYTKQQLDLEGDGIKKLFKDEWTKALKPLSKIVGKNCRSLQSCYQIGSDTASRNPQALLLSSIMHAGRFVAGKGIKILELTNGG